MAHQQPDLCKGMRVGLVGGILQRRADPLALILVQRDQAKSWQHLDSALPEVNIVREACVCVCVCVCVCE